MADGGRTDFWAPDSSLDPIEPGVYYQDADGKVVEVCVNDFVDLDIEGKINPDPIWGSSFQVIECRPSELIVRAYDPTTDLYGPIAFSTEMILDVYKRRPHLDVLPDGATVYLREGQVLYQPESEE
jgi:hypothetical protein